MITSWVYPTHPNNRNKQIFFQHQQLANISNTQVVNTFKLVKGIELGFKKIQSNRSI